VRNWYENRACEVEQLSGQVDGALQLVKLAIDKSVEVGCHSVHDAFICLLLNSNVGKLAVAQ